MKNVIAEKNVVGKVRALLDWVFVVLHYSSNVSPS
jgi:hypothetical protein